MSSSNHEDWDGSDFIRSFGKVGTFYPPKETLVETCPDKRRSSSRLEVREDGKDLVIMMEIFGLGVVSLRTDSHPDTGRLQVKAAMAHTDRMLLFGLDAEENAPR